MAEELLANIGELKIIKVTTTGPSSYSSGGFTVRVSSAKEIKAVLTATNDGGYKVDEGKISIDANEMTVPVLYYDYDATADGVAIEPSSGDLSGVNFTFILLAV